MKFKKWTVILTAVIALGVLIATSLLSTRLTLRFPMLPSFGLGQLEADRLFADRHRTFVSSFGLLFALGLGGILILYLIPGRVRGVADAFSRKPGRWLRLILLGFLIEVLVVIAGFGSALKIGTFLLTILLMGAAFIVGLVGFISLAYALGRGLLRSAQWKNVSPVFSMLLGLAILLAFTPIPILGAILFLVFSSLGLGATILSHFGSGTPWTLNPLSEE